MLFYIQKRWINLIYSFKPEALAHHQKACSKENPFKPLPGAGG